MCEVCTKSMMSYVLFCLKLRQTEDALKSLETFIFLTKTVLPESWVIIKIVYTLDASGVKWSKIYVAYFTITIDFIIPSKKKFKSTRLEFSCFGFWARKSFVS